MKNSIVMLVFALAASAAVFTFNLSAVEGDFSVLEVQAKGAVLASVEKTDEAFPETLEIIEAYYVIPEDCIGCGICVNQCPVDAIIMTEDNIAYIDPEACINCGMCASGCPTSTIELLDSEDCQLFGIDADGNKELIQEEEEVE